MTVRARTSPEATKQRGGKQSSEVFAIPRVPNVIYTARLNTVPSSTDMVAMIAVTGGSGTAANIRPDMKMLIGTSAGADDLGFCRVRATPTLPGGAGNVKIGEQSHIDWQASCFLTIVDDYDILPRHLRILAGEAYIDYETDYTDQHTDFDPIVNMGGHRVLELEEATVSHIRSSSTSQVFDGTIASRLWEAPGASSISGATTATATITYDTPGHYVEYLTLTSNDGKTWTGVRYVFIVDPATLAGNIQKPRVSESAEGVSATFEMVQNATLTDFNYRAFVILFARDYYNGVRGSIGYVEYEENILASGRISDERITWTDGDGVVQFVIKDWKYWMGKISSFPFGLERANNTAAKWTDMTGLNVDRAIWALLHEYCTVTRICDFHPSGDTRYAEELSSASSNLDSQVDELAMTSIFAELVFDRFGSAWLRIEPQLVPEADRTGWATVATLTTADYQEGLSVEPNEPEETAQVNSSGVYVAQFGTGTPRFSLSYGRIPAPFGDLFVGTNLLLSSQAQSNSLAGLMMGWNNRRFDGVTYRFTGNVRLFSIAEYCYAATIILAADNPRGIAYSGNLIPRQIDYEFDDKSGFMETIIEFQDESEEQINVTGDFPADTGIDEIDFSMPPFPEIPVPTFPPIVLPPSVENLADPKEVIVSSNSNTSPGVFYTRTFDATNPEFLTMNAGLNPANLKISRIVTTPSGAIWVMLEDWSKVYRASGLGGVFSEVSLGTSGLGVMSLDANPIANDEVFATIATASGQAKIRRSTGGGAFADVSIARNVPVTPHFYTILYYAGKLYWFGSFNTAGDPELHVFTPGGTFVNGVNTSITPFMVLRHHKARALGDKILHWFGNGYSTINPSTLVITPYLSGTTPMGANGLGIYPEGLAISPTGNIGMGAMESAGTPVAYKTTDQAVTWSAVSGVIPNGSDVWENCRDDNRFIFGGGIVLRITKDLGLTYTEKAGNLGMVAPLIDITGIRYIS